jgi:phosphomannomutase
LLGSDVERNGRALSALPTRDAFLPILSTLFAAREKGVSLCQLFAALPKRYSRAALLRNFPREKGRRLAEILSRLPLDDLQHFFRPAISRVDLTDGPRIVFANGEVAHFRPSGNADEFRVYAVAGTQSRADEIVAAGVADPDGTVRAMESALLR